MFPTEKKFNVDKTVLTSGKDLDNNILDVDSIKDMFREVDSGTIARGSIAPILAMLLLKKRASVNCLARYIAGDE